MTCEPAVLSTENLPAVLQRVYAQQQQSLNASYGNIAHYQNALQGQLQMQQGGDYGAIGGIQSGLSGLFVNTLGGPH